MRFMLFLIMVLQVVLLSACTGKPIASGKATPPMILAQSTITATSRLPLSTPTPVVAPGTTPSSIALGATTAANTAAAPSNNSLFTGGCNNASYVSDMTIPDGIELAPGESFVKTWMVQNTGTCAWSKNYSLTFSTGDRMGGSNADIERTVEAGKDAQVSVSLTAPDLEGTYKGYWTLADARGNTFGESVYVQIVVSDDAVMSSPAPTTIEETSTANPTNSPTADAGTTLPNIELTDTPGS